MAFFTLTDIKISDKQKGFKSSDLLPNKKYMSNVLRYPIDIGSLDKGHYMVIHINQQVKTRFKKELSGDLPTILQNQQNTGIKSPISQTISGFTEIAQDVGKSDIAKVIGGYMEKQASLFTEKAAARIENMDEQFRAPLENALEGGSSVGKGIATATKEVFSLLGSDRGLRTIERTTDSIAFYMPDTLNFTNNQQYSTMEFGASPLAYLAAATAGYSQIKNSDKKIEDAVKNLTPFILNSVLKNKFGNAGAGIFAAGTGTVLNPQLEMIYTSPSFREFRFDFMLYPRSSKEALEVQRILNRLRFHQAPEIFKEGIGALGGFFMVPPSEFDIEFYYNGRINPNIPRISTCVLTSIDTDYAPNGWSAYEVPENGGAPALGKTGMPVGIKLSLNFQETEILTKDNFNNVVTTDFTSDSSGSIETRYNESKDLR
jgi:hypothetical protein